MIIALACASVLQLGLAAMSGQSTPLLAAEVAPSTPPTPLLEALGAPFLSRIDASVPCEKCVLEVVGLWIEYQPNEFFYADPDLYVCELESTGFDDCETPFTLDWWYSGGLVFWEAQTDCTLYNNNGGCPGTWRPSGGGEDNFGTLMASGFGTCQA
jgi:hypothetical protein